VQVRLKVGVQFHQVLGLEQANAATDTVANTPQALKTTFTITLEVRAPGASPFFAHPEMGSVRFRAQTMGRRPLPSAARVRPGAHSARHQDSRNDLTPVAWPGISPPSALTRCTPTKRSALRLPEGGGARRSALTLPCFPALLRQMRKVAVFHYPYKELRNKNKRFIGQQ